MEPPLSKKHHYIPEFLIKNFCDDDGLLYVYDKQTKRYLGKKSPGGVFYEIHRNTIEINGTKTDNFEKFYSSLDDRFAKALNRVITTEKLSLEDLMSILVFATTLKWRVPNSDETFNKLKESIEYHELPITIRTIDASSKENEEMLHFLIKSATFKEAKRIIFPMMPFLKGEKLLSYNAGSFINTNESFVSVLGDCGIIEASNGSPDELDSFVMPLSTHTTFIYKMGGTRSLNSIGFYGARDILTVQRSERYIGCKEEKHLRSVIEGYEKVISKNATDIIERILFDAIP